MDQEILISNGYIAIPESETPINQSVEVATLLSNLAYYGFALDQMSTSALSRLTSPELTKWWNNTKKVIAALLGEDRKMGDHVVYKNFPREVLNMDVSEQIFRQIAIYHGIPYDFVREEEEPRSPLGDMAKLKVLTLPNAETEAKIFANLMAMPNRWSDKQTVWANKLLGKRNVINLDEFAFKENGLTLMAKHFDSREVHLSTGTDLIRLCAILSDGDVSLRERVKFRNFSRPERRKLLDLLEQSNNIAGDFAARPEIAKRLLERLRPGDYNVPKVRAAYDALYHKKVKSFAAKVDPQMPSQETLETVATRPGEFLRRFHHFYDLFGAEAANKFCSVMDKLTTKQLVNFRAYLGTINDRSTLIYPPKSNWARAQVAPNKKGKITQTDMKQLNRRISSILRERLKVAFPEGIDLDPATAQIKLQTNDQKLAEYGRGTSFDIPAEVTFLRSASFWEHSGGLTWYDNGWNFFDEDWAPLGTCGWDAQNFSDGAAIMSGDPVNIKDFRGRGCQMIDLNLAKMPSKARFAVWNILCYSRQKFSEAKEVLATLQMGEVAEKGKLYEPSRAQMVFPLKSDSYTSFIAYVDLKERKLVYMDAPLKADVLGTSKNSHNLSKVMPAYVEYLNSLPSVFDLMQDAPEGDMPVMYDDLGEEIAHARAFVFRPQNAANEYERVTVTDLVTAV